MKRKTITNAEIDAIHMRNEMIDQKRKEKTLNIHNICRVNEKTI